MKNFFKKILSRFSWPVAIGVVSLIAIFLLFVPRIKTKINHSKVLNETLWFINFSENAIDFKAKEKMDQRFSEIVNGVMAGNDQLRVLHIGDSHVQADFFTGETRRLLSDWLSDSNTSRGFTFPYEIAASNNPDDYKVSWEGVWTRNRLNGDRMAKIGLAGISLTTSDTSSELGLRLVESKVSFKPFDRVRVIYESTDTSITPMLINRSSIIEKSDGAVTFGLAQPTDTLKMGIEWNGSTESSFTLYGIDLLNSKAKVIYNAAGVNGATVRTFLQSENFEHQVLLSRPQLIIVSLGTNDAFSPNFRPREFRRNLSELIDKIQQILPTALIILTTPGDHLLEKVHENPNIEKAQVQIHAVAREQGCGVWDFYRVMGGAGSVKFWSQLGLTAPDKLHLNRKGYKLQGALLFDALIKLSGDTQEVRIDNAMFANE